MSAGGILHRPRRRFGAPVTSSLPSVPAAWSDTVNQRTGVNVKLASGGYQTNGPNFPALAGEVPGERAVRTRLIESGVRHVRDVVGRNNNANQTQQLNRLRQYGITAQLIVGKIDGSMGEPDEIMDRIGLLDDGVVHGLEGNNEVNLTVSGGGFAGWENVNRTRQISLWNNRAGRRAAVASLGGRKGYSQMGNLGAYCTHGNTHQYPGGNPPDVRIDEVLRQERQYVTPNKTCDMTETGFHTAINSTGTHYPTPEAVAGVYADRLVMDHFRNPLVEVCYLYQFFDNARDDAKTDQEKNFGLCAWDAQPSPSWRGKPQFWSIARLLALTKDQTGPELASLTPTTYTPSALPMTVTGGGSDLRWVLLGKRDGTYLAVLWRTASIWTPAAAGGASRTVAPVTVTITTDGSTVTRYRPSTGDAAIGQTTGAAHTVSLGANLIVAHIDPS